MESFLAAAKKKWSQADDLKIAGNWLDFEKSLLRHQKWSFGRLNVTTLQTFQDMYCHLQWRVRLTEDAFSAAAEEIEILKDQLAQRTEELAMQEELGQRLEQFREFMVEQETENGQDGQAETISGSAAPNDEELKALQSRLESTQSQKDGLEKALQTTQSQLEEFKLSAESSARSADQGNAASNARLKELQEKLQGMKLQLEKSVKQSQSVKEEGIKEVERRQKQIDDLELQITNNDTDKAVLLRKIAELENLHRSTHDKYRKAQDNIRELFDQCQDLRGNLRVMCRIRPQLGAKDDELAELMTSPGPNTDHLQVIKMAKRTARTVEDIDKYELERVFGKADLNEQIFGEVGQLVGSAINGRNVCIFAYGQTGSGKTHTMNYPWNENTAQQGTVDYGIIPRSVERISNFMNDNAGIWKLSVTGKYVEIYAEKVYDLLRANAANPLEVNLRYGKAKGGDIYEAESTELDLTSAEDFEDKVRDMLTRAAKNRRTRATASNTQSSRSHSVLTLRIVAERVDGSSNTKTEGLLNLIDLAGSEKPSKTDRASQAEGIQINKSLSTLRKVLGEMANPKTKHISFRESVLTKLLQASLGEGCKTLMFVMVSPLNKDREETRNTLEFAITAQQAKLR